MTKLITINGASVDQDDPCALYQALYAVKLQLISGESVQELSIQSPVTRETVTYSAANIKALDAELLRLSAACSAKNGRRSRYAKGIRYC